MVCKVLNRFRCGKYLVAYVLNLNPTCCSLYVGLEQNSKCNDIDVENIADNCQKIFFNSV